MGLLRGLIASFWMFFFISVASVYFFPHPQKLDGMAPRISFYSSVLWSILGLKESYNVDYFGQLYSQSSNQTYPQAQPNKQPYTMKPLPSIDASDKDWEKKFHDIFIKQDHAVVVRGLQKNNKYFPGAKNWSLKNIAKSFGNKKIPVFKDHLKDKSAVLESFDEYLENLHKEDYKGYARCLDYPDDSIDIAYNREKILELMNMEFGERFTHAVNNGKTPGCIFVGNSKLNTNMHCDIGTSAFLMIEGQKRWIFFPPSESMYLFPMPHQFNVAYNTIMDIFNFNSTNLAKYPMLHMAKGFEVILNPGDVLFFPSMWWHAVQNIGITYGIDLPIFDPIMSIKRNPLLSFGTLFNLRAAYHLAVTALSGKAGGKSLFFKGYMVEDDEATNLGQEKKN